MCLRFVQPRFFTPSYGVNATLNCDRFFFFSSRRRHTRCSRDWSSDVCSSDLRAAPPGTKESFLPGTSFTPLISPRNSRRGKAHIGHRSQKPNGREGFPVSLEIDKPEPSESMLAADRGRRDLFLCFFRVAHRVLRSLDGVVQIVFVDFQLRAIRRVLLENGKKLFGARGHKIGRASCRGRV